MKSIWRKIFIVFILALIAGIVGLLDIYPYRPRSVIAWGVLFVLALPLWIFFEFLGDRLVSPKFLESLSSVTRIIIGVIVGGGWILFAMWSFRFLEPFFVKWGS